jgi:hypothetical protein
MTNSLLNAAFRLGLLQMTSQRIGFKSIEKHGENSLPQEKLHRIEFPGVAKKLSQKVFWASLRNQSIAQASCRRAR